MLDWQRFHGQYNVAFDRNDNYFACLLCSLYNAHRGEKEKALSPEDFLLYHKPERFEEKITKEEFVSRIKASMSFIKHK